MKHLLKFAAIFIVELVLIAQLSPTAVEAAKLSFVATVVRPNAEQLSIYPETIYSFSNQVALPIPYSTQSQISIYNANDTSPLSFRIIYLSGNSRAAVLNLSGASQQFFRICSKSGTTTVGKCVQYEVHRI